MQAQGVDACRRAVCMHALCDVLNGNEWAEFKRQIGMAGDVRRPTLVSDFMETTDNQNISSFIRECCIGSWADILHSPAQQQIL